MGLNSERRMRAYSPHFHSPTTYVVVGQIYCHRQLRFKTGDYRADRQAPGKPDVLLLKTEREEKDSETRARVVRRQPGSKTVT